MEAATLPRRTGKKASQLEIIYSQLPLGLAGNPLPVLLGDTNTSSRGSVLSGSQGAMCRQTVCRHNVLSRGPGLIANPSSQRVVSASAKGHTQAAGALYICMFTIYLSIYLLSIYLSLYTYIYIHLHMYTLVSNVM
jgi:hypothetical protein